MAMLPSRGASGLAVVAVVVLVGFCSIAPNEPHDNNPPQLLKSSFVSIVVNKAKTVAAKIIHHNTDVPTLTPTAFPTSFPGVGNLPAAASNKSVVGAVLGGAAAAINKIVAHGGSNFSSWVHGASNFTYLQPPTTGAPSFFHNTSHIYGQCRYAEAYPSAGGPDCPKKCAPGEKAFSYKLYSVPWRLKLKMEWARGRLRSYGTINQSYRWHMSFMYLCCYTQAELKLIKAAMREAKRSGLFKVHKVKFDRIVCRLDNRNPTPHVSFIVLADDESNRRMQRWAAHLEARIAAKGVKIKSPRRDVQPFHITIGWMQGVDVPEFKYAEALDDVNTHGHIPKWPPYYPKHPHLNSWATDER